MLGAWTDTRLLVTPHVVIACFTEERLETPRGCVPPPVTALAQGRAGPPLEVSPGLPCPGVVSELGADSLPLTVPGLEETEVGIPPGPLLPIRTSQRRTWTLGRNWAGGGGRGGGNVSCASAEGNFSMMRGTVSGFL